MEINGPVDHETCSTFLIEIVATNIVDLTITDFQASVLSVFVNVLKHPGVDHPE